MTKSKTANITVDTELVEHIAQLSSLPLDSDTQSKPLIEAFQETLAVIDNLKEVDTQSVEPTHQVTGLENIWRNDEVDTDRMFTQEEALANAQKTHDGYFVVPPVLDQS